MRRKNLLKLFGAIVLAAVITMAFVPGCAKPAPAPAPAPTPAPAVEQIVLDAVTWSNNQTKLFDAYCFDWFMNRVYAYSNGELKINWKGGQEVMAPTAQFEGLRKGLFDVLALYQGAYVDAVPESVVVNIVVANAAGEIPPEVEALLAESYERVGVHWLGLLTTFGPWHLYTSKKCNNLQDVTKLKIGATAKPNLGFIEAIGATPVTTQVADEYTSLDKGVIDGLVEGGPEAVFAGKLYEVTTYLYLPPYKRSANSCLKMNADTWNSLPPHLQKVLNDVMVDFHPDQMAYHMGQYEAILDNFRAVGQQIVELELTPEELELWTSSYGIASWKRLKDTLSPERYNETKGVLERSGYPEPEGL